MMNDKFRKSRIVCLRKNRRNMSVMCDVGEEQIDYETDESEKV